MIDKLISSDLSALAAEDRQAISAFELPRERPHKPARSWRLTIMPSMPFLLGAVAAGGLYAESRIVAQTAPQLAIALALVVMAMFGLAASAPRPRPLADLIAAGLFTLVAVVGFTVEWHQHRTNCTFIDAYALSAGPCQESRVATTTWFAVCAWAGMTVLSRLARGKAPRMWAIPSKLITAAVLLTWTGLNQYIDLSIDLVRSHATPWLMIGARGDSPFRVRAYDPYSLQWVRTVSDRGQWNAVEAGLVALALAVSIGVACTRETKRPSRWLRLLESPFVIPLGAIVASVSLVLATAQFWLAPSHRGDPDDIPWFAAWASVGAVVAYASMLLRRRRREALS